MGFGVLGLFLGGLGVWGLRCLGFRGFETWDPPRLWMWKIHQTRRILHEHLPIKKIPLKCQTLPPNIILIVGLRKKPGILRSYAKLQSSRSSGTLRSCITLACCIIAILPMLAGQLTFLADDLSWGCREIFDCVLLVTVSRLLARQKKVRSE